MKACDSAVMAELQRQKSKTPVSIGVVTRAQRGSAAAARYLSERCPTPVGGRCQASIEMEARQPMNFQDTNPADYQSSQFVNLAITEKIFPQVMNSLRDAELSDKEARYLAYLVGICGTHGCTFRLQKTIGSELHKGDYTIRRIEKSLQSKGRLRIFDYGGRTYRSPYPTLVDQFLASQEPTEAPVEPTEQSCQAPPDKTVTETPPPEPTNPTPEATHQTCSQAPYKNQYKAESLKNPVQREPIHNELYQPLTQPPVDNSKDWFKQPRNQGKNPYHKNRFLVKHMADEICETLGIWQSWKWVAKQVWSVSEEMEQHLLNAVSWVKEELACCRCTSPAGLLTWKLRAEGIIPSP